MSIKTAAPVRHQLNNNHQEAAGAALPITNASRGLPVPCRDSRRGNVWTRDVIVLPRLKLSLANVKNLGSVVTGALARAGSKPELVAMSMPVAPVC